LWVGLARYFISLNRNKKSMVLWAKFCQLLNRPDMSKDPRFRTNPLRTQNVKELIAILEDEFGKKTTKIEQMKQEGIINSKNTAPG